jgi:hypothetical protein
VPSSAASSFPPSVVVSSLTLLLIAWESEACNFTASNHMTHEALSTRKKRKDFSRSQIEKMRESKDRKKKKASETRSRKRRDPPSSLFFFHFFRLIERRIAGREEESNRVTGKWTLLLSLLHEEKENQ